MSMFHIGQQVVCIQGTNPGDPMTAPYEGCVYTISAFLEGDIGSPLIRLQFEELKWEGNERWLPGFWSGAFRPVKETNIEIFQKLLAPTPELVS